VGLCVTGYHDVVYVVYVVCYVVVYVVYVVCCVCSIYCVLFDVVYALYSWSDIPFSRSGYQLGTFLVSDFTYCGEVTEDAKGTCHVVYYVLYVVCACCVLCGMQR